MNEMIDKAIERPAIDLNTLNVGDVLKHPRGATAVIREIKMHQQNKHKRFGVQVNLTEADGKNRPSVPIREDVLKAWYLHQTAEQAAAEKAAEPAPADENANIVAEPPAAPVDERELQSFTGAGAQADASLKDEKESLFSEIMRLTDERSELRKRNQDLLDRAQKAETEKSKLEGQLHAALENLDQEIWGHAGCLTIAEGNKDLPAEEKMSPAMKAVAQLRSDYDAMVLRLGPPSPPMSAPCKEFKIVRHITEADLTRNERDGWIVEYMQFLNTDEFTDALNVVYFRYSQPAPVQPQPGATATVKTVAPDSIINPADELIKPATEAEMHLEEADLIEARAEVAPTMNPLPRFNADQWMAETLTASMNAANSVTVEQMSVYNDIRRKRLPAMNPARPAPRMGYAQS